MRPQIVQPITGSVVLRDPKDVEFYRELFEYFSGLALWGEQAREFIAEQAEAFRRSPG